MTKEKQHELKNKLENDVKNLMQNFQRESGCLVYAIDVYPNANTMNVDDVIIEVSDQDFVVIDFDDV